ncbi:MAG: hypothetical protein GY806_04200 [Gammaproteobacteria bacterium]|nr:hypothetical protein [Gammaproteobacteria bacterium]
MNYDGIVKKVSTALKNHDIAVWCGAGVAVGSGLPVVVQFVETILKLTPLTKSNRLSILKVVPEHVPFEHFMQVLLDARSVNAQRDLLQFFSIGTSSLFHQFVAYAVKEGWLKSIFTTNFDPHCENAIDAPLRIWSDPVHFKDIEWQDEKARILKLHGSVESPEALGVTLRRVAQSESAQHLKVPIERLFSGKVASVIVFFGYSFSDKFDLSPLISQTISEADNIPLIFVIDHIDTKPMVRSNNFSCNHPLAKASNVFRVRVKTENFIHDIISELGIDKLLGGKVSESNKKHKDEVTNGESWCDFLQGHFEEQNQVTQGVSGHYVAGALLSMIGADGDAIRFFERAVRAADKSDHKAWKLSSRQALSASLLKVGNLHEALRVLDQAKPFAKSIGSGRYSDHTISQRASLYQKIGDYAYLEGKALFERARIIAIDDPDNLRQVPHLNGIASSWQRLGDMDAALQAYRIALPLVESSGDLYRLSELQGNIASLAYILRDYKSAVSWYQSAIDNSVLCGDFISQGTHTMNLGNVLTKQSQFDEALQHYRQAKNLLLSALPSKDPRVVQVNNHINIVRHQNNSRAESKRGG